ncbi:hypothetical protein GGF32_007294, partial [Allomyces javanicus]
MTDLANKMTADHDNAASEKQVILYTPSEIAKIAHNEAMVHMTRSPWEQRVGSAPMAIAAMGLLRCLVVGNDFSINDSKPTASAFTLAQTNMNKIVHKSKNVNDNILVLFTILSEGDMEMVREMLPGALGPVSDDAKNCRKLADEVTAQFGKVKALTEEVEQACLAEQSASATKLTQVKKETAINQTAAEESAKTLDMKEKQVKETGEMAKDAQEYYRHIDKSEPTGWNSLAKAAVGVGVKVSTHVLAETVSALSSSFSGTAKQAFSFFRSAGGQTTDPDEEKEGEDDEGSCGADDDQGKGAILPTNVVDDVSAAIELLQGLKLSRVDEAVAVVDGGAQSASDGSVHDQSLVDDTISKVNAPLKRAKTQLQAYKDVGTAQAEKKIIDKALELAQRAQDLNRELNQHPGKLKAFYDDATQLDEEQSRVVEAVAKRKEVTKKRRNKKSSGKGLTKSVEGILSMAIDKEYEVWESRVHRSREDYKTLRAEYAEQLKELEEMQAHNAELLKSIVQGHSEVTNLTEIVKLLKEGVQALGRLQVHWANLSLYFQDLADVVDACNTKVETLAKQAGVMANKRLTSGDQLPVAYQKLLYGYCVRADALSRVVGAVSTMYVGVSENDLQPLLLRLGKVNELDKKEDIKDFARQLELEALK